jgi:mannonate dehydratase
MSLRQTWRWFGPDDKTTVDDMRQAGVEGVVTGLGHVPTGAIWSVEEIEKRKAEAARMADGSPSTLAWEVVESLLVSEDIKKQHGSWREHTENYKRSLENLARCGIRTVCYNFMPALDWTRTDLRFRVDHGGTCMRFDLIDFAIYDIYVLARKGAAEDYDEATKAAIEERLQTITEARKTEVAYNIMSGLPGAAEELTLDDVRQHLAEYGNTTPERLQQNFIDFLEEIIPVAERLDMRLGCHPDDPPFPLLGLPRVMSTEAHLAHIVNAVDSPANGITFCSGSLGARPDNDLPGIVRRLGHKFVFLHLRNVHREMPGWPTSFNEVEHLGGDNDMVAILAELLAEEDRRKAAGRPDWELPMRPDHGQDIIDDIGRGGQPGYPTIGRLKGLAELRGIITALRHPRVSIRPSAEL